jgi:outer membrane receptor protein involved in Fe transport
MAPWQSTDLLLFAKLNQHMTGSFGIYNLFDQKRELNFGYPEPQRRTAVALEYYF